MQVNETYLVQTYNGHSWETDAELHDERIAARHQAELIREFDYSRAETRIIAFIGGDHGGAADAWNDHCAGGKPAGRKLMAALKDKHGLSACAFLIRKTVLVLD